MCCSIASHGDALRHGDLPQHRLLGDALRHFRGGDDMPRHHLLGDVLRTTTTNDDATLVVDVERSRSSRRPPL